MINNTFYFQYVFVKLSLRSWQKTQGNVTQFIISGQSFAMVFRVSKEYSIRNSINATFHHDHRYKGKKKTKQIVHPFIHVFLLSPIITI